MIMKRGNLWPPVETIVRDENGVAVDVSGSDVFFSMRDARNPTDVLITGAVGAVVNGPTGHIKYEWLSGDQLTPAGSYEWLFKVVPPTPGRPYYAPTDGWGTVTWEESF